MTDHPFTILIVDEDAEARDQWVGILQAEEQHELIAVRGEEEAATYLKARPFNMIVVDVTDKEQQEMAFIPAYRQRWPNCLVIVTTAQGSLETAVRALRLGAFDYLVKPLRPEDMRATFNRAQA